MDWEQFAVEEETAGLRLDVLMTQVLAKTSRSQVQKFIEDEVILVNDKPAKANYKTRLGDRISYFVPEPEPLEVVPENIPLDILYEDSDLLVVNKPRGMVVHPAAGVNRGTLVNALLYHCKDLSGINGILRPGIVHRIDKDTSGLLLVAKNDFAHQELAKQMKEHTVKRIYLALVHGTMMEPGGVIDAPIGRDTKDRQKMAVVLRNSKHAVTHYRILERLDGYTLIECKLETGRTHQIRVHMAYLRHPVVGDPKYGPKKAADFGLQGQALHAGTIGFVHPRSKEYLEYNAVPPLDFQNVLAALGSTIKFAEEGE